MTDNSKKVAPIPKGYRSLTPHVLVSDVAAAVAIYQSALGAEVVLTEALPGSETAVFVQLRVGNSVMTLGQGEAFGQAPAMGQVMLHYYTDDFEQVWTSAIDAGFVILEAPDTTWWGDRMGALIDPLGVRWSVAQRVERVTAQERAERKAKAAPAAVDPVANEALAAAIPD